MAGPRQKRTLLMLPTASGVMYVEMTGGLSSAVQAADVTSTCVIVSAPRDLFCGPGFSEQEMAG